MNAILIQCTKHLFACPCISSGSVLDSWWPIKESSRGFEKNAQGKHALGTTTRTQHSEVKHCLCVDRLSNRWPNVIEWTQHTSTAKCHEKQELYTLDCTHVLQPHSCLFVIVLFLFDSSLASSDSIRLNSFFVPVKSDVHARLHTRTNPRLLWDSSLRRRKWCYI